MAGATIKETRERRKVRYIIQDIKTKDGDEQAPWQDAKIADGHTQLHNGHQEYTPGADADRSDAGWKLFETFKLKSC